MAKQETVATVESLSEEVQFLKMQLNELSGKHTKPRVKANPEFSYEKDHDIQHYKKVPIDSNMQGVKEGAMRLIPTKVIIMPTKENPYHEQGKPFECDTRQAEEHIKRGFAIHHKTWEENEKDIANAAKKEAAEKK